MVSTPREYLDKWGDEFHGPELGGIVDAGAGAPFGEAGAPADDAGVASTVGPSVVLGPCGEQQAVRPQPTPLLVTPRRTLGAPDLPSCMGPGPAVPDEQELAGPHFNAINAGSAARAQEREREREARERERFKTCYFCKVPVI